MFRERAIAPLSLFAPWCFSFAHKEAISPTMRNTALANQIAGEQSKSKLENFYATSPKYASRQSLHAQA